MQMSDKRTTIFIDNVLYNNLKVHCAKNNISIKEFINDAIVKKLNT